MRMFDLEVHKFVIVGILCASYVLYLFTASITVCIFAAVAIFAAHSAQRQQPSALGLTSQHNHAPISRRRFVSSAEKNVSRDSFHNISKQVTPITSWGISKSNYSTLSSSSVRSSPAQSQHNVNVSRNVSRATCGFASQVVSTAYNYPPIDQSHYRGLGLFPTIHLNKSRLPVLSGKNTNMVHNPVTVRIAPPEKNITPSPRKDFIFNSKVQTPPKSSVKSVLKSLQQNQRKRSCYNLAEESEESRMKRQRRENSPRAESVFKSASTGNVNLLNGMRQPTPSLSSVYLASGPREDTPIPRMKTSKNNEIFSSYSSVNRSREGIKRRLSERIERSPAIKISKLRNTKSTAVFSKSTIERCRSISEKSKTFKTASPDIEADPNLMEDEPNPSKIPRLSPTPVAKREGYSRKRELSLYKALNQKNLQLSHRVPQSNSSVEDDNRDQVINQARLHRLLAVFQAKDDDSSAGNRSHNLFSSRPLQVSLGTEPKISPSPAPSVGLLSIAPILPEPVTKSNDSWVPRIDVTTTTTSLTTLSSTGSDRQEVEKIHVSSFAPAKTDLTVMSSANSLQLQSSVALAPTSSILGSTLTSPSLVAIKPLVTASFVSMPLTPSIPAFNLSSPVTANLSLQTSIKTPEFTKMSPITPIAPTTSNAFAFGAISTPTTKSETSIFGQQLQPANSSNAFVFNTTSTPKTKPSETPIFGQQMQPTTTSETPIFGQQMQPATTSETPIFGQQMQPAKTSGTPIFGQQMQPANPPNAFGFGPIPAPTTKLPETPVFGQQLQSTNSPSMFALGANATPKAEPPSTPVFGLQIANAPNKFDGGNNIQPFHFNAAPQTAATAQRAFNPLKLTGNGVSLNATTSGGFNFNMNSVAATSAPSTPAFSVNSTFGQAATTATAFNTSNSTGGFNFAASSQAVNGPLTIPNFNAVVTTTGSAPAQAPAPGLASQFTFGQGGGFSFNFAPEPSSVGVTTRKSIQARRRTSRQH